MISSDDSEFVDATFEAEDHSTNYDDEVIKYKNNAFLDNSWAIMTKLEATDDEP